MRMREILWVMTVGLLMLVVGVWIGQNLLVENAKSEAREEFVQRHGRCEALIALKDLPAGTVLDKNNIAVKTIPMTGLSGRVIAQREALKVIGCKTAFALEKGNVILTTDLVPKENVK